MFGTTETETEVVFDLNVYVEKQHRYAKLNIIVGIFLIPLVLIGLINIILGVSYLKMDNSAHFAMASKNLDRIARRKNKSIRYVNVPAEYIQKRGAVPIPAASTKFCSKCGDQITSNEKFCKNCGNAVNQ
jgi:hypothetical protein